MQFEKQNKWKSQQIDKYYKNHSLHYKRKPYSRPKTNSLNPDLRHWKSVKGGLYNRLKDKSLNTIYCQHITKNQNYVSFMYDNDHDAINERECFSLWSCLNCTYNNLGTSINCVLCNTPNYALYIKSKSNNKQQTNQFTLADYLSPNKSTKKSYQINNNNDNELLQIAIELSYKNININKQIINKYNTNNINQNQNSFINYWKDLQKNKIHKQLFKNSCNKYLIETKIIKQKFRNDEINNVFTTCLKTTSKEQTISTYINLMSIIPSTAKIRSSFCQLFPDAIVNIKCILNPYILHQFIIYGCKRNVSNVRLVYTDIMLKSYNIYENPVVLPNIANQELLIYGLVRTYFSKLIGVPDDIIIMISCFYNINRREKWKLNTRNAPTKRIICYSDLDSINDGYMKQNGKLYVCLINSKNILSSTEVVRNANILPIYSIHWFGYLGFMKFGRFYGSHEDTIPYIFRTRRCLGQKILKFEPKYGQINDKKANRKLQRKWSAYHKLSHQ
eukprot:389262_1